MAKDPAPPLHPVLTEFHPGPLRRSPLHSIRLTAMIAMITSLALLAGCRNGGPGSKSSGGGAGTASGDSDTIPIGEFGSMTGDTATFGVSTDHGIQMQIDRLNAAGGVLGKKLEVITKDDGSQADQASTAVEALLSQNVVAVLGEVASTRSLRGAPICQEHKIPMISPASTNPKVTQVGDYIFRVCFIDPFQGQFMSEIATDILHVKRAAMLFDNTQDYSKGLKDVIDEKFAAAGGQIVAERSYSSKDVDFRAQLTEIQASNPQVVFVPGYYNQVALIAQQARQLGITAPLVGGDGWDSDKLISVAGNALEGCYFTDHFAPDDPNPLDQNFVKEFKAKYDGQAPDAMACLGYDAAGVLVDAIKRAGSTDPQKLRDAIASTKNYPGVSGTITIGPDRNAVKPVVVIKISHGKFTFVRRFAPQGQKS